MKKLFFCILGLWSIHLTGFAQRSEVGLFGGGAFYLGDLNPTGVFSQTKPAFGGVYRYNLNTRWALRGNILWGRVSADDSKYNNPRALNFRSNINEFSLQCELNFLPYFTGSAGRYRFSPYLFGGIGVFTFNPQAHHFDPAKKNDRWVNLPPLSTEGQGLAEYPDRKYYNTTQISFPFGIGFKYSLNRTFSIGVEWGMRKTFTDYIDDVSTTYVDRRVLEAELDQMAADLADRSVIPNAAGSERGNPNTKDWYSYAGITITAKIRKPRQGNCPANKPSSMDRIRRSMME